MPNFVKNKIIVGNRLIVDKLKDKYITYDLDKGEYIFDFNRVIKRPLELDIEYSSFSITSLKVYLTYINPDILYFGNEENKYNKEEYNKIISKLNEINIIDNDYNIYEDTLKKLSEEKDIDKMLELGERQISNLNQYGAINWYFWSLKNWSCKWNSSNTKVLDNAITFETPWSEAFNIILEISKQNPTIKFAYLYADEDIGYNAGYILLTNGKIDIKGTFEDYSIDAYKLAFDLWDCASDFVYDKEKDTYVPK